MLKAKNVSDAIRKVHEAAMKEELDSVSELVVELAKDLVGADNGRLRFVDYTGRRLVPGAIKGALAEKPEMAVREFGECVVGHAAETKQPQFVDDVQKDPHFIKFEKDVRKRGIKNKDWRVYHEKTLAHLGSEIAMPVLAGKNLLGVLSVNTFQKNAFKKKEDEKLLSTFASEIAVAFLNRKAMILEELHRIEEEMISVFELEQVAQHIADGIRKMVQDSIPNIFLFDENREGSGTSTFRFLASAGASEVEKELGAFEPRPNGRGMEAIEKWRKGQDAFVVVEDVQKDRLGSPTAKEREVKTTGCLPLVFRGTIVGLLYLHFKKRHFFTIEEKRVLEMFAAPAAIAIKNATILPTYVELFGNGLIRELDRACTGGIKMSHGQASLNMEIWQELKHISEELRTSRGEEEISECILQGVKRLCSSALLDVTPRFSNVFRRFQRHEGILYTLPYYRDHFIHMFHVFYLGYLILNWWWIKKVPFLEHRDEGKKSAILKSWFISSIQHDIAYPIEMAGAWVPRFPKDALDLDIEIRGIFDWGPILSAGESVSHIEEITQKFLEPFKSIAHADEIHRKGIAFKRWFIKQLLEGHDHGALGSLSLLNLGWPKRDLDCAYGAALNVVLHNYWKNQDEILGQLPISSYPLAFLLTYCDSAQEWGRTRTKPLNNHHRTTDTLIKFGTLEVDLKRTAIVLKYSVEEYCSRTVENWSKMDESRQRTWAHRKKNEIRTSIDDLVRPLRLAWGQGTAFHNFAIKAQDEQDPTGKPFCDITVI